MTMNQAHAGSSQDKYELITFRVRDQEFGVDVMSVREIRVWTPATPLAHAPPYICGVINLRGVVLPIVDLAVRLGEPPTEASTRHAILVVQVRDQAVGLLVEGVSEILSITGAQIQSVPDIASNSSQEMVSGIVVLDGRMISMITLEAMLKPSEFEAIAA
jgi:purine-binding chemotaxis protein CheW